MKDQIHLIDNMILLGSLILKKMIFKVIKEVIVIKTDL